MSLGTTAGGHGLVGEVLSVGVNTLPFATANIGEKTSRKTTAIANPAVVRQVALTDLFNVSFDSG